MEFFSYPQSPGWAAPPGILETLDEAAWRRIMPFFQSLQFRAGDELIAHGDGDQVLFILVEGAVDVYAEGRRARPRRIASIAAGSVFGEMAFFDQGGRSASVRATLAGTALKLDREAFRRLGEEETAIAIQLLLDLGATLSTRLRDCLE